MSIIKWEEPPVAKRGKGRGGRWAGVIAELRARPGEWALVAEGVSQSLSTYLKKKGLESVVRGSDGKNVAKKVYARWPEGEEA